MSTPAVSVPTVSVLLTSYNRERYLAESIESVLAQTFEDFELLVVDDASTDGSADVARAYAARDPRVRVVVNAKNLGQFENRNHAASLARAPLLKFHDSDDVMYPHCLEVMVPPLLARPEADFALSASRAWEGGPCPLLVTPEQAYQREYLGTGFFFGGPANAVFRTELFRGQGGYPLEGTASDFLFWVRACRTARVLLVPTDLFWYRIHPGQALVSDGAARSYAEAQGAAWRALFHPQCPLSPGDLPRARRNAAWNLLRLSWRDLRARRPGLVLRRLRSARFGPLSALRYLRRPRRDRWAGIRREDSDTMEAR